MKTEKERIKGLIDYYQKLSTTDTMAKVLSDVSELGKRTQQKVRPLIEEAQNHGVILGLSEALRVLETQPLYLKR